MASRSAPRDFAAISFDCFGTLIDWESGIVAAMQPLLARHELVSGPEELLAAYARAEAAVEAGPYRPYREVLRRTVAAMAKDLGFAPQPGELEVLVASLPSWPPFPDTRASLAALRAAGHRLAIVSNVDDDQFAPVAATLEVDFAAIVTAAQVHSYKPNPAVFERACAQLGLAPQDILHVANSRYHDIATARGLGMQTVHVRRDSGRSQGATLAPANEAAVTADWSVADLACLLALLG